MKKEKRLLFIFLLLMGVCAGCGEQKPAKEAQAQTEETKALEETILLSEINFEAAFANVLPSSVSIQVKGHRGSGSIFDVTEEEIVIATGRHVLQYFNEDSSVTFFNGVEKKGGLLYLSEAADLGFIGLPVSDFTRKELLSLQKVCRRKDAFDNLQQDDKFFMVNLSGKEEPVMFTGSLLGKQKALKEFETEMLYGDGEAKPGMSGCGIFDGYGNYIGLLSGGTESYELAGVPLPVILEEYEKLCKK